MKGETTLQSSARLMKVCLTYICQ